MTSRLWLMPVGAALLAPLVTWLPALAQRFAPYTGLPLYDLQGGIDAWGMHVLYGCFFGVVAVLLAEQDAWLAATVAFLGMTLLLWGGDPSHRVFFMLGALTLWGMRQMPARHRPLVLTILAASGVFQTAYVLHQMLGFDVLWVHLWTGGVTTYQFRALGTLGTEDAAASYIAITAPLMPLWALPFAALAVLKGNPEGHSLTGIVAFVVGMLWRFHRNWRLTGALTLAGLGAATMALWKIQQWHIPSTALARLEAWHLGVLDWWHTFPVIVKDPRGQVGTMWSAANPITGNGDWWPRIAQLQHQYQRLLTKESFGQAHNEWLEWCYTYGLIGAGLLAGWLRAHRRMFSGPVAASLVALAISAGGFFPFQMVALGLLAICLVAVATLEHPQEVA